MSPPTEQLIRDYLNRLSLAARGQLGTDDRRALVDRTREFIERKTGAGGPPTPLEVGRLLFGLGDPAELVSQERQRLATLRGEALEPVSRGRLTRVLRGEPGKVRGASRYWPVQPGSRARRQIALIDGAVQVTGPAATAGAAANSETARPVAAEAGGRLVRSPASPADPAPARQLWPALAAGAARDGTVQQDTAERDTGTEGVIDGGTPRQEADRQALDQPAPDQPAPDQPAPDHQAQRPNALSAAPSVGSTGLASMTWQLATDEPRQPSRSRQLLASAGSWSRRHKLEAVAIVLLGLGGAIFPPVWLLGGAVALASRLWDYRDKWTALALPVLLTVIGTAAGVAVGSRASFGHGMHEAWVFAVGFSRATAVLSACFLGWRAGRGRRSPAVPPWDRPHRVT